MGRDRLDRISSRQQEGKNHGNDSRIEKSQMVTIENLRERREAREIEDLKSEINILKGQLSKEREKLEEKEKKGMKDSDRKLIERELGNLEKQLKRAQEEITSLTESRDSFKKQVTTLQSEIDNDSRLIQLKEELKLAKELSTKSAIKLQALEEESQVYKERCKTLESVQEQQVVEKELTKEIKREKKKLELGQVELEKEIKQLEQAQDDLLKSLEDARKKIVTLEQQIESLEKDNARLIVEKEELVQEHARQQQSAQSKPFSRLLPSLFGTSDETANVEKELKKENKELKQNLTLLEKRYQVLSEKKGISNESANSGSVIDRVSKAELYDKLCENLSLDEDGVNLLLTSGIFWPPCRRSNPENSIIDLLWMLTDQQEEFDQEKTIWEEEKTILELQVKELKRIGGDNGEGWEKFRTELEELEKEQENLRVEKFRGEEEKKELLEESKKKEEIIAQLEARITAYEEATPIMNGTAPRSPPPSIQGGTSISIASGFAMKTLVKTISDLNEQLAAVRHENTSLLLKLVSSE
ncbi:hypothetical protein JCM5350_003990 [Sporobolomyces pararoseus]